MIFNAKKWYLALRLCTKHISKQTPIVPQHFYALYISQIFEVPKGFLYIYYSSIGFFGKFRKILHIFYMGFRYIVGYTSTYFLKKKLQYLNILDLKFFCDYKFKQFVQFSSEANNADVRM